MRVATISGRCPRVSDRTCRAGIRAARLPAAALCLVALGYSLTGAVGGAGSGTRTPGHLSARGSAALPLGLRVPVSVSVGAGQRRFWPARHGESLVTRGGGIRTAFSARGAELTLSDGALGLAVSSLGRGARLRALRAATPRATRNRVRYERGALEEYYRNGPYGLEQAFALRARPAGAGALTLAISLRGALTPLRRASEVLFADRAGHTVLRYGALSASDAAGRSLPARFGLAGHTIYLRVDDRGARYPLRIDPFFQSRESLEGENVAGAAELGASVALSGDGKTALVGGPRDNEERGAAWVFVRSGGSWIQQGAKLTTGEAEKSRFGISVALSSDGNTGLVGAPADANGVGSAWILKRSEGNWSVAEKLAQSGEKGQGEFGISVALSADASTALVGGLADTTNAGAAWVFTRGEEKWTQQGAKLIGCELPERCQFGSSVALSSNGNTALVGGESDGFSKGAAWVFTRSGETWSQQGAKLKGGGETGQGKFGASVSLAADGNTALIGGFFDKEGVGAAWVFTRGAETWSPQGGKLLATGSSRLGESVSLRADGNVALIGERGAAWVFTRSGSTWTRDSEAVAEEGEEGTSNGFGASVSLSADGSTALVGSPHSEGGGVLWAFTQGPSVATKEPVPLAQTTATLKGEVNPNGNTIETCVFEYGTTTAYGAESGCSPLPPSGSETTAVSAAVTGLSANTLYHVRITVKGSAGTTHSLDRTFKTLPEPPTATTVEPSEAKQTVATLAGTVNPHGGNVTRCEFEYGTTTAYGSKASCASLPGSGTSPVAVSAHVQGLSPSTSYHFKLVAENAGGPGEGEDESFTTPAPEPAAIEGEKAAEVSHLSATLQASVDPNGAALEKCEFRYGTTTAYGQAVSCTELLPAGNSFQAVSAALGGLAPNTTYHFKLVVKNEAGTSEGADHEFTTLPEAPATTVGEAGELTQTSATLAGTVNPHGAEVGTCEFEYGTTLAYGSKATCSPMPGAGSAPVAVSAHVLGLSANTLYHVRLVAANTGGSGASTGEFKTLPPAPTVLTGAASEVRKTSVTLSATVNPNGGALTQCKLRYGTSTEYEFEAPCTPSPESGSAPVAVSAAIGALAEHTTYHFTIVATNAGGTSEGSDQTFTTLPLAPAVATGEATQPNTTSATLNASVNPDGMSLLRCEFEYGTTTAYGSSAPCEPAPGAGEVAIAVHAAVTGLIPATTYHFRIIAENSLGKAQGGDGAFATLTPPLGSNPQPPAGGSATPAPPGPPFAGAPLLPIARLAGRSLAANAAGVVKVKLACPPGQLPCSGTLKLQTLSAVAAAAGARSAKRKSVLTLAHAPFTIAAGRTRTLTLRLSGVARALLARSRTLKVRATILVPQGAATSRAQATVTIRPASARSRARR